MVKQKGMVLLEVQADGSEVWGARRKRIDPNEDPAKRLARLKRARGVRRAKENARLWERVRALKKENGRLREELAAERSWR